MWNEMQFIIPLRPRIDLTLTGYLRVGRNVSSPVEEYAGASVGFHLGRFVTLAPGYAYVPTQSFEDRTTHENRLLFAAIVRSPSLKNFTFSYRNLTEGRLRISAPDSIRNRNRLQVDRPIDIRGFRLGIFASNEVSYDSRLRRWSRNRFAVGVSRRFSDRYAGDVYYLRQNDAFSRPGDLHVIGTTFRVRF